jgi:hypothetical protein
MCDGSDRAGWVRCPKTVIDERAMKGNLKMEIPPFIPTRVLLRIAPIQTKLV